MSHASLYNFENAVEQAADALLTAAGFSVVTFRENVKVNTPYVEIGYTNGTAMDFMRESGSYYINQRYAGTLTCTLVTDRADSTQNHTALLASVRYALNTHNLFNSGSLMPSHSMQDLTEQSTVTEFSDEDYKDLSAITYQVVIDIKPEAWI